MTDRDTDLSETDVDTESELDGESPEEQPEDLWTRLQQFTADTGDRLVEGLRSVDWGSIADESASAGRTGGEATKQYAKRAGAFVRSNPAEVGGAAGLVLLLGVSWFLLQLWGPFLFILYTVSFISGLALVPILAWTIGPSLGPLSEGLANGVFIVSMLGVGRAVLKQLETDEYVIEPADADMEPRRYWGRWAFVPFGITFEKTKEAFAPVTTDPGVEHMTSENRLSDASTPRAKADLERGGKKWYVDLSVTKDIAMPDGGTINRIYVPIGEKLAELRDAAGSEMGVESMSEAFKEHGGDTSEYSPRTDAIMSFLMATMGLGMGYVIFF